jgi:hypothetical protein
LASQALINPGTLLDPVTKPSYFRTETGILKLTDTIIYDKKSIYYFLIFLNPEKGRHFFL